MSFPQTARPSRVHARAEPSHHPAGWCTAARCCVGAPPPKERQPRVPEHTRSLTSPGAAQRTPLARKRRRRQVSVDSSTPRVADGPPAPRVARRVLRGRLRRGRLFGGRAAKVPRPRSRARGPRGGAGYGRGHRRRRCGGQHAPLAAHPQEGTRQRHVGAVGTHLKPKTL